MVRHKVRSIAAAAVGAAMGLTLAAAAHAQAFEVLYQFGSYVEPHVAVDQAGNIVVVSANTDVFEVCDPSDPAAVRCRPFGTIVAGGGPPGTFWSPSDVDFDGAGSMIVADSANNRIQICDASDLVDGPVACEAVGGFDYPRAVAALGPDRVAVAERSGMRLCDISDRPVLRCESLSVSGVGLAVDSAGRLFVANGGSRLSLCDISDWQSASCQPFGGFARAYDVTLDGRGNLLVIDILAVQRCDLAALPADDCEVLFDTVTQEGYSVAVDRDGNIVVADVGPRPIRVFGSLDSDADGDDVLDSVDNCPADANRNQTDTGGDGRGDACDEDDDNDGFVDVADNCPLIANDQADLDGDEVGDACDADVDDDGVDDGADQCLLSTPGDATDADGCSIAQRCPCDGGWKNHGTYVSCVGKAANGFAREGWIGKAEKGAITSAAARSSCGKK